MGAATPTARHRTSAHAIHAKAKPPNIAFVITANTRHYTTTVTCCFQGFSPFCQASRLVLLTPPRASCPFRHWLSLPLAAAAPNAAARVRALRARALRAAPSWFLISSETKLFSNIVDSLAPLLFTSIATLPRDECRAYLAAMGPNLQGGNTGELRARLERIFTANSLASWKKGDPVSTAIAPPVSV